MDDLLIYGVEKLEGMLKSNPDTKKAFKSIAGVFEEISAVIEEDNKGMIASLVREYLILSEVFYFIKFTANRRHILGKLRIKAGNTS